VSSRPETLVTTLLVSNAINLKNVSNFILAQSFVYLEKNFKHEG
jgi:hypothetical protein